MNHSFQIALAANMLALLAGSASGKAGHEIGPEQTLSIHLYDQAQVSANVLHSATVETTRLFRTAGIKIAWERPLVEAPEDRGIDMRSSAPQRPDERPYLVVRLVRHMPASALPGTLGFALPFARTGAQVSIFYDRVEATAWSVSTRSSVILGHVLLGSSKHANSGLMQARWNSASWRLASAGLLTFRPEEAEHLSAGLQRFRVPYKVPEQEPMLAWSAPRRSPE